LFRHQQCRLWASGSYSDRLFHACLEIAATCPARQDSSLGTLFAQRIAQEERRLIEQTFALLESERGDEESW